MSMTKDELQSEAYRLEAENNSLRELGAELRKSAEMIGYVQSADMPIEDQPAEDWGDDSPNDSGETRRGE